MNPWILPHVYRFAGQEVRYGVLGSGKPLVLIHGTPFSSVVWRRIAPLWAAQRCVYFYDLLGYGQSEKRCGQDVSLGVQNRLLSELLMHWGLVDPDVVAHDFGGATALRAHLLDGCEYRSLLLIDSVAIRPWGSPFVRHVRLHETAFADAPAYIHVALLEAYIKGAAFKPLAPDTLRLYTTPWCGPEGQSGFYRQIAQMDQCHTDEIRGELGRVRCPVTLLWGEQDAWIPLERGYELADHLRIDLSVIPEAGHLMQEDAPEAIVAHWLRSQA